MSDDNNNDPAEKRRLWAGGREHDGLLSGRELIEEFGEWWHTSCWGQYSSESLPYRMLLHSELRRGAVSRTSVCLDHVSLLCIMRFAGERKEIWSAPMEDFLLKRKGERGKRHKSLEFWFIWQLHYSLHTCHIPHTASPEPFRSHLRADRLILALGRRKNCRDLTAKSDRSGHILSQSPHWFEEPAEPARPPTKNRFTTQ